MRSSDKHTMTRLAFQSWMKPTAVRGTQCLVLDALLWNASQMESDERQGLWMRIGIPKALLRKRAEQEQPPAPPMKIVKIVEGWEMF